MDYDIYDAFGDGFVEKLAAKGRGGMMSRAMAKLRGFGKSMRAGGRRAYGYIKKNPGKAALVGAGVGAAGYAAKKLYDKYKSKESTKEAAFEYLYEKVAAPKGKGFMGNLRNAGRAVKRFGQKAYGLAKRNPGKTALIGLGAAGAGYGVKKLMDRMRGSQEED